MAKSCAAYSLFSLIALVPLDNRKRARKTQRGEELRPRKTKQDASKSRRARLFAGSLLTVANQDRIESVSKQAFP